MRTEHKLHRHSPFAKSVIIHGINITCYNFSDIMVRIKTRWLLVRIDYADALNNHNDIKELNFPGKNEFARVIRDNLIQCSGIACSGAASDTQGTSILPVDRFLISPVIYKNHRVVAIQTLEKVSIHMFLVECLG